jgi:hypothetical protein
MKFSKIAALIATSLIVSAGSTMFAGKANAAAGADSTATFGAAVAPSCTVGTAYATFSGTEYAQTGAAGPSGGSVAITANKTAAFDCNSNTVNITTTPTLTQPTPGSATAIIGNHNYTVTVNGTLQTLTGGNASGVATDVNGDVSVQVGSTWTGGEDLLSGTYRADVALTVTAQ